eukprot:9259742-Ditylum_brightwellii.AAC.1
MQAQDETTSSSPSGHHYRHYKAILDYDDLCLVHIQMMSLPWLAGFTPLRWEQAIDCMLEKDPGNPRIKRLRLIVIVEGDMNATLKIIWKKRLVSTAGKTNFLSPVQFGNRKGRTALDALFMKIVTMDCIRLFRLNRAILNNDAAACYNRMILELTAVHLKTLGLPDNATKKSVQLNHRAKHHIKTTASVTEEFYQSTTDCPLFGEGQGNTYVNEENQSHETPESIRDNMQHTAQTREQLLFGSGGRLCPKKTF